MQVFVSSIAKSFNMFEVSEVIETSCTGWKTSCWHNVFSCPATWKNNNPLTTHDKYFFLKRKEKRKNNPGINLNSCASHWVQRCVVNLADPLQNSLLPVCPASCKRTTLAGWAGSLAARASLSCFPSPRWDLRADLRSAKGHMHLESLCWLHLTVCKLALMKSRKLPFLALHG